MDSMLNAMGFRRVVDYGKPTHYECPACGSEGVYHGAMGVVCWCKTVRMIPVYAFIPEGERPQTTWGETGGDDAVVVRFNDAGQCDWYEMGFDAGPCEAMPFVIIYRDGGGIEYYIHGHSVDIVTAIRHVAEE